MRSTLCYFGVCDEHPWPALLLFGRLLHCATGPTAEWCHFFHPFNEPWTGLGSYTKFCPSASHVGAHSLLQQYCYANSPFFMWSVYHKTRTVRWLSSQQTETLGGFNGCSLFTHSLSRQRYYIPVFQSALKSHCESRKGKTTAITWILPWIIKCKRTKCFFTTSFIHSTGKEQAVE